MSLVVLDTDIISLQMRDRLPERARALLLDLSAENTGITAISLGELLYGALRSAASLRYLSAIEALVSRLHILPFAEQAARRFAELQVYLHARGEPLDDADLRIAAICCSLDAVLVSGNERHFARVPGLKYENWLKA